MRPRRLFQRHTCCRVGHHFDITQPGGPSRKVRSSSFPNFVLLAIVNDATSALQLAFLAGEEATATMALGLPEAGAFRSPVSQRFCDGRVVPSMTTDQELLDQRHSRMMAGAMAHRPSLLRALL